jgi:hypothetical protein
MVGFTLAVNRVDADALVHDRQGTGYLTVSVGVTTTAQAQGAVARCQQNPPCVVRNPSSDVTVMVTETLPETPKDAHVIVVNAYHGQTHVDVELANTDMQAVNGGPPVPTRAQPVLTVDQAVDLAVSPRLYLFP